MALNFGNAAQGALGGASAGATLGSIFPGIGNLIGAGAGGLVGGLSGLFSGGQQGGGQQNDRMQQINRFNPQQQAAFSQALQQAQQGLASNKFDFAPKAAQARNNFAQQTVPGIAERFSQAGAQGSSAFGHALGSAGAELNSDLAGMEQDYNLNERDHLMRLLGLGLEPQFDTLYEQGQQDQGNSFADFFKNPQNLMNLYQLYQGVGGGAAGGGQSATDKADAAYNAQQGKQNNLIKGNFGATSAKANPIQFGQNLTYGKSQGGFNGADIVSPQSQLRNAGMTGGVQPNILANAYNPTNKYQSKGMWNPNSFAGIRQNYINSFNR